jgi:hypothetical protein
MEVIECSYQTPSSNISFDHFSKVPKLGLFTFTQLSKGYYIRLMWNDEREDPKPCLTFFLRKVTKVHVTYKNTNIIESFNSLPFNFAKTFILRMSQSTTNSISLKHWDAKNATSENLVLAPFHYNMVGFFLHTFSIDFLSCMKARLTCLTDGGTGIKLIFCVITSNCR